MDGEVLRLRPVGELARRGSQLVGRGKAFLASGQPLFMPGNDVGGSLPRGFRFFLEHGFLPSLLPDIQGKGRIA